MRNPFKRGMKTRQHELLTTGHYEFIEGIEIAKCFGCGSDTNRVDISWGAHVCSVGCRQIADLRAQADLVRLAKVSPDYPEDQWWADYSTYGDGVDRSLYDD